MLVAIETVGKDVLPMEAGFVGCADKKDASAVDVQVDEWVRGFGKAGLGSAEGFVFVAFGVAETVVVDLVGVSVNVGADVFLEGFLDLLFDVTDGVRVKW